MLEVLMLLHAPATFVLLDEPFSGLAPNYIEKIKKIIVSKSKSKGIILTDHQYKNVVDISKRIILLKNGKTLPIINEEDLQTHGYISKI